MSPLLALALIGWLPVIPAALAYALTGRRVRGAALALAALGLAGWAGFAGAGLSLGWYAAALAVIAAPGVAAAALVDDLAEELTVAGWVYVTVAATLTALYLTFRDEGIF